MQYTSVNVCELEEGGVEAMYSHDRGVSRVIIKEPLITSPEVAVQRATSELLKGGYVEQWVQITSTYIADLKQNDIITFKGNNWLVKEIGLNFQSPKLIQTIKGLRYD